MITQSLLHSHFCFWCQKEKSYKGEICLHSIVRGDGEKEFCVQPCEECLAAKPVAEDQARRNVLTHIDDDFIEDEAWLVLFPNEAPKWMEKRLIGWLGE